MSRLFAVLVLLTSMVAYGMVATGCTYETVNESETMPPEDPNYFDAASLSQARSGGWSASVPMKVGQEEAQSGLNPTFPIADYYTVRFGVSAPPNGIFACTASIQWVVEGNIIKRQVSVANGIAISGTGQSVDVKLQDVTGEVVGGNEGDDYSVSIQVSRGTRPVESAPPILQAELADSSGFVSAPVVGSVGAILMPPGSLIAYNVPQDAGAVSFEVAVAPAIANSFLVTQTNSVAYVFKATDPGVQTGFVALEPGTTTVTIANDDPTESSYVTLTWGIEG